MWRDRAAYGLSIEVGALDDPERLERYVKGKELLPQIVIGCYYEAVRNELPGEQRNCYAAVDA